MHRPTTQHIGSSRTPSAIAVAIACGAAGSLAVAGPVFTPLGDPPGREASHASILSDIYGGSFSSIARSEDLSNGEFRARRVPDAGLPGTLRLEGPGAGHARNATDQQWAGLAADVVVRARYAGDRHTFGLIHDGPHSEGFIPLVDTRSRSPVLGVSLSESFSWALRDETTGSLWTSRTSDNLDAGRVAHDRLVTYHVTSDSDTRGRYLLFWDDRINGQRFDDDDFNDAVIEIAAIPAPGSLGALVAAGALASTRRRRAPA